jgi:dihydrofolate reductase
MRKLIARVFDYSLDGLIATEDTAFFQFCRDLPDDPAEDASGREFYAGADLHIMGRAAYQSMASYFPTAAGDPNAGPLIPSDRRWAARGVARHIAFGAGSPARR